MKQNSFSSLAAAEKYAPFKFQDTLRMYENPPSKKIKCCRIVNTCKHCQTKCQHLNSSTKVQQLAIARQQYKDLFRKGKRKNISRFTVQQKMHKYIEIPSTISKKNDESYGFQIQFPKRKDEQNSISNPNIYGLALNECDNNQIQNRGQILIEKQNIREINSQEQINNQNGKEVSANMNKILQSMSQSEHMLSIQHNPGQQLHEQQIISCHQNYINGTKIQQHFEGKMFNSDKQYPHDNQKLQQQCQRHYFNRFNEIISQQKDKIRSPQVNQQLEKHYTQVSLKSYQQIHQNIEGKITPDSRFRIKNGSSQCLISTRVLEKSIRQLNDVDKIIETILQQRPYLSESTSELKQAIKQHLNLQ